MPCEYHYVDKENISLSLLTTFIKTDHKKKKKKNIDNDRKKKYNIDNELIHFLTIPCGSEGKKN